MLVPYSQRGGFPIYAGRAYQRGRGFGSIMSSVFRNLVVPAAKSVGKSLLQTGLKKASNVMRGVAEGKNIKQAIYDEVPTSVKTIVGRNPTQRNRRVTPRVVKRERQTQRGRPTTSRRGVKRKGVQNRGPATKRLYNDIFEG